MWVSASEKSLRESIAACGSGPLWAEIAARYRHGLDIEIPDLSSRVFISTAAKGLFPSHFAVRQPVLDALLQKPIGSRLWIRTDPRDRTAPDTLTLSPRTFDLYLPHTLYRDSGSGAIGVPVPGHQEHSPPHRPGWRPRSLPDHVFQHLGAPGGVRKQRQYIRRDSRSSWERRGLNPVRRRHAGRSCRGLYAF